MKEKWLLFRKTIQFGLLFLCFVQFSCELMADDKLPQLHHRSNFIMPEGMLIPPSLNFELTEKKEKKIVCKTCHGIKDIENKKFDEVDKLQSDFLRNGPYEQLTDFCYLCHKKEQNQRENIHILLHADLEKDDQKKEQQCLYCHSVVLKEEELEQQELKITDEQKPDLKLRLPVETLCFGCHLKTPHLNALEHQVKISDEMLLHLKKNKQLYDVRMPLGNNNQVICVTCHDPHQQGVLKNNIRDERFRVSKDLQEGVSYEEHPWADVYTADKMERLTQHNKHFFQKTGKKSVLNYKRIKNEVLLRLPAKNGMLCIACHDFTQERLW